MNYIINTLPDVIEKQRPYKYNNGVITEKIPYKNEWVYNPTMIACHAIRYQDDANIKWLLNHQQPDGSIPHNYQSEFSPPAGWIGGLSQSLIASTLLRAGYNKQAHLAIDSLLTHCYKGGVIYERPSHLILNGWIYGIFGLIETGRDYEESIEKLREYLPTFDSQYWSIYDSTGILATPFYHQIHIKQLIELSTITNDFSFLDYTKKWRKGKQKRAMIHRTTQLLKRHKLGIINQWWRRKKWQE